MVTTQKYKVTEVGNIPEEWEIRPLEEICTPDGLVRGPFGGTLKKENFVRDGYKVYEQRNAIYRYDELGTYYITESKYQELKRFQVKPRDFIVSCSGTIGRIFQIPKTAPKGVINQALLKITTDESAIFDRYFYYLFEWDNFQKKIIDNTQGGAMQNLVGMEIFRKTLISLPPLAEQRAIAAALSDVDALLASLDALIAKKRLIQQGAMQELLTGKRRLPGFSGEWEFRKLGDLLKLHYGRSQRGIASADGEFPILGTGGIVGYTNNYIYTLPSIIIGRKGTIDIPQYVDVPFWAIDTTYFTEVGSLSHPKFLYYLFTTINWYSYNEASGVPSLSAPTVESIEVKIPKEPEQRAIAEFLSEMDYDIHKLEQRRDKTRMVKQGMMQELLTGRTRLNRDA